jgi:hypothetical protein
MSPKIIEYSDQFGRSRFAQVVFERDAALAQVEKLKAALADVMADILWVGEGETVIDCIDAMLARGNGS